MALMFAHDSAAGRAAVSMTFRWMPLDHRSSPPCSTMTFVGRARACSYAARRRLHCSVLIAPL